MAQIGWLNGSDSPATFDERFSALPNQPQDPRSLAVALLAQRMRQQSKNVPPHGQSGATGSLVGELSPKDDGRISTAPQQPINAASAGPLPQLPERTVESAPAVAQATRAPSDGLSPPLNPPPLSNAPQAMGRPQQAAGQPSFLDRLGEGINNNSQMLMALGAGLAGAPSIGAGIGSAMQFAAPFAGQNQTVDALVKRGVPRDLANAAIRNPAILNQIIPSVFGPKQWQWAEIGKDANYNPVHGWINPVTREVLTATGQPVTSTSSSGIYQPSLQGQREEYKPELPPKAQPSLIKTALGDDDAASALNAVLSEDHNKSNIPDLNMRAFNESELVSGDKNRALAIAEGRAPILTTTRPNSPNVAIMRLANDINPHLDATLYQGRQKAQNSISGGPGAEKIIALNRYAGHTATLLNIAEQLDRGGFPNWNAFKNWIDRSGLGEKKKQDLLGEWDVVADAVAGEGAKVFAGKDPTLGDREQLRKILSPDTPFTTMRAKLRSGVDLADTALESTVYAYNQGMRTNRGMVDFLTPKSRAIFDALKNNQSMSGLAGGGQAQSQTQVPQAAPAAAPPYPGAQRAPDGNYYVKQGTRYFRVEQ